MHQTRIGTPSEVIALVGTNRPTTSATKYVDIFGVSSNLTILRFVLASTASASNGAFDIAVSPGSMLVEILKVALCWGSSMQGNIRRASVGSIWVASIHRLLPEASRKLARKKPFPLSFRAPLNFIETK